MGIIMGALGGMGAAGQDMFSARMKSDMDLDSRLAVGKQNSELDLQRQQTMEVFKNNLAVSTADQQRSAQTSRIDAEAGKIADATVIPQKRGIIQGGIADQNAWTPEQQATVEQSLAGDRQTAISDPKIRTQAAIASGDIAPKDAATLASHAEIQQIKTDALIQGLEGRLAMAKNKGEIQLLLAEIKAAQGGNISREERMRYTSLLGDAGRRLGEAEKALSTLQKDTFSKIAEPGSPRALELDDLRATVKRYREEHKMYQSLLAGSQTNTSVADKPKPDTQSSASPAKASPYAEGTRLTGPGDKPFIVKNGIPVPQ